MNDSRGPQPTPAELAAAMTAIRADLADAAKRRDRDALALLFAAHRHALADYRFLRSAGVA